MLRGVLREVGLAAASLLASIFVMTFVLLVLASIGIADAAYSVVSGVLAYYILPCSVGLGTVVAVVQNRWRPQRLLKASLNLMLVIGLIFSLLISFWVQAPAWNLFFLLPGFALWGLLSGWFAQRRAVGVAR